MEWRDRGLEEQGADSPILALKQSNRKGGKPRKTSWLPTLEALWDSRGRREGNRGTGCMGEMSSVQALETWKVGSVRWVLDLAAGHKQGSGETGF